ncbi:protein UshA precursor [includes: UDP-sugar hydrolase; 5'-nucleotidase] [Escherichia coli]|uniref:Protein UshA [includes: UDP-sugar hydrolase 5'-nucleotidase] n=1 Tax=Escherichia coli TaxID=562 RepID=A0A2X3JP14_ECOLX|nr:protein UshA precursor [includes: UDP-sugar hydrolase; 5'-nucleotidase] [Escherichia coli]
MARALPAGSLAMIVGGHSQDPVCMAAENKKQVDYVPGTPCKPDQQNGIWIVQAHEWGKYVGRADFEFRNGEMKMVNYQLNSGEPEEESDLGRREKRARALHS